MPSRPVSRSEARASRLRRFLLAGSALLLVVAALPHSRAAALGAVGRWLAYEDSPRTPDVVAVLSGGGAATVLEAVDLAVQSSGARVVLFESVAPAMAVAFRARGVAPLSEASYVSQVMTVLGVPHDRMVTIPLEAGGTSLELQAFRSWLDGQVVQQPVIVSAWHHSHRVARVARRIFAPGRIPAVVIPRDQRDVPGTWWRTRDGLRVGIVESQKLLLDVVSHPWR